VIPEFEKAVLDELNLKSYEKVILLRNRWDEISKQSGYFVENNHITKLIINGRNEFTSLPERIGDLVNLKEFYLYGIKLRTLPESFENLINLQRLRLCHIELKLLPENFGNLENLHYLDLSENKLTILPKSFGNLVKLRRLDIYRNNITSLPENFGNHINLRHLDFSENELSSLPENIGNLKNLQSAHFGKNQLLSLPVSFGNLVNLQFLDLSMNKITFISESFENLVNLRELYIFGNPLLSLSNISPKLLKIGFIPISNLSPKAHLLYKTYNMSEFFKYYKKSPAILAQQYIKNPKSLTSEEKERLSYEAGHLEKKILELSTTPKDPILVKITERLAGSIELPSGYKLQL